MLATPGIQIGNPPVRPRIAGETLPVAETGC
jgi:hypothetical protein